MKYNLTEIFENTCKRIEEDIPFSYDAISIRGEEFELMEASDIRFIASNIEKGKVNVKLSYNAMLTIPCDRCLIPVKKPISIELENVFFSPDYTGEDKEESVFMESYRLDLDELVLSELLLEWPSKILCKNDCKGICLVCGSNLNEGECGCDRFVPNPAFAGLKDLIKFD